MGASAAPELGQTELALVREFVRDACGIALDDGKHALVSGRLAPVLAREGITSYRDYIQRVRDDASGRLRSELVDRISTNHTFFWREAAHLEHFGDDVLPPLIAARRRAGTPRLRVWCAASSLGQEPYTLAALMIERLGRDYAHWDAGVLATDISAPVLARARDGYFEADDVARLPAPLRKHFPAEPDGRCRASARLRAEVTFRRLNLMSPRFPFKAPFDVVFIRNVMIYFDVPTKLALLGRLAAVMLPRAALFIGAAESLPPEQTEFVAIRPGVFARR